MKKNIIVPADFGAGSFIAAGYAAFLSKQQGWIIHICHVYRAFNSGLQTEQQNKIDLEAASADANAAMNAFLEKVRSEYPGVDFQGHCIEGKMTEVLIDIAKEWNTDMIVMSAPGNTGVVSKFIASYSYQMINECDIPVIITPSGSAVQQLTHIGFTTNFHSAEIATLHDIIKLLGDDVAITAFHLYEDDLDQKQSKMESWSAKVNNMIGRKDIQFKLAAMEDLASGIINFVKQEKIDLLAMTRTDQDVFEKIFKGDIVRIIAQDPALPVLFIKEV